jgi:hypothetical protein
VGIDVYPGTWQTLPAALDFSDGVGQVVTQAISNTRSIYMPLAGLPSSVPIQISETGYPTGAGRTDAAQESALEAEVNAVNGLRTADNVTALQFFDLRDAITDSTIFEDQYGLMTDQWVAKPAFTEYQSLVAQLGGAPTSNATRGAKPAIPANPPTSAPSTMSPKNTPVTTATGQSSPAVTQTATESSAKGKRHKRKRKATEHRLGQPGTEDHGHANLRDREPRWLGSGHLDISRFRTYWTYVQGQRLNSNPVTSAEYGFFT